MPASEIIKEYLVSLGVQDNLSEGLGNALENADGEVQGFVKRFGKQFAIAGATVVSIVAATSFGIAKFLNYVADTNDEVSAYAAELGKTEDEAYRIKSALDVMGKSMEEIQADPELLKQFEELRANAEAIQLPDMSQSVGQIKDMKLEFLKMKQEGMLALNWIGFYTIKYLQGPLQKAKEMLSGMNNGIIRNMPKIADTAGRALASIVRIGITIIRGAQAIFKAIKKVFDLIPKEVKIVMASLAALGLFIRAGPIGRLIMIISAALLLLDDFFTYIDGGEAKLSGLWQKLIDIYNTLKDNGTIDKFKEAFTNAFEFIQQTIINVKDGAIELFKQFKESGSIEKFISLLSKLKDIALLIIEPLKNIGRQIIDLLGGKGMGALEWLVSVAMPKTLDFLNEIAEKIKTVLSKLNELGLTEDIIKSIGIAFLGWKVNDEVDTGISKITSAISDVKDRINELNDFKNQIVDFANTARTKFSSIKGSVINLKGNIKDLADTAYIKFLYAKEGVGKMYDDIKNYGTKAIDSISKYGSKAVDSVTKYGGKAAKGALSMVKSAGSMMIKGIGSAIGFFTSPVGLIILAVTALIAIAVLVIKNWDKVKEFFIKFGTKVKEIFSDIVNYIKEKWSEFKDKFASSDTFFGKVLNAICTVIEKYIGLYIDFFKMLWEVIKGIFSIIKSIITGDFQGAYEAVVGIWEAITGFFQGLFEKAVSLIKAVFLPIINWFGDKVSDIKDKFLNIPQALSDKFSEAVEKIKEVFTPIVDWFSEKVETIKGFFGGIGDKISGATDWIKGKIGGYAEGGLVTKQQIAQVAEGNKPELIVPLTNPKRAKSLITKGAEMLNMLDSGLNRDYNYAYSTSNNTVVNNYNIEMPSNYKIYDSSGNPNSTAKAVDRTKQMQVRNLKGIL